MQSFKTYRPIGKMIELRLVSEDFDDLYLVVNEALVPNINDWIEFPIQAHPELTLPDPERWKVVEKTLETTKLDEKKVQHVRIRLYLMPEYER
ncbi:MAG TPA: hypothetical protein V6D33_09705 [Cyanophyceae cyanobacterium]